MSVLRPPARGSGDALSAIDDAAAASCRSNSFLPATGVLMADGSTQLISEVDVGDLVYAADPVSGESGPRLVTDVIVAEGTKQLVEITIDGDTITATDGHPFWVVSQQAWVEAGDLKPGERLLLVDGLNPPIDAVREYEVDAGVHNISVDDLHPYYVLVGDDPVLVP
jgi:intein/homing endonuclease